jgi:radical SAM protein with 4Fe4S-binding SPASM domain
LLKTLGRNPNIIICGGEPLTSPILVPLLVWLKKEFGSVPLTLLTNGTLVNPKVLAALKEHETYIQISIDGPDADSHDCVRGYGAFKKSILNVATYQAAGFPVSLMGILSKRTSPQIESFFKLAKSLNVSRMKFTRFIPAGEGGALERNAVDRPLIREELRLAYEDVIRFSRIYGIATNSNKALFNLIDRRIGESEQFGFNGIVVDFKGNMKVSSRIPVELGNVLTGKSITQIFFDHPLMRDLRDTRKHECGSCPYFRRCGGSKNAAWAQLGSLFRRDPGCWLDIETESSTLMRRSI